MGKSKPTIWIVIRKDGVGRDRRIQSRDGKATADVSQAPMPMPLLHHHPSSFNAKIIWFCNRDLKVFKTKFYI